MKKVAIILTAAITTALLSSCAKDYTCTCAYTIESDTSSEVTTTTIKYKVKKKNSEDPCNSLQQSLDANENFENVTCAVE